MCMRQARIAAATMVAKELFEAEAAIDKALASIARLQAVLPEARVEANLSAVMGQDVIDQVARSLAAVVRVRRSIVGVHARLDELKTDIGLREMAMGGLMQKRPFLSVDPQPALRLVDRGSA